MEVILLKDVEKLGLRGDRAEQAPVSAGLLGDGEHRAVEQADVLLGAFDRVPRGALGREKV